MVMSLLGGALTEDAAAAAAMRTLLAQWRIEVSWWRGGFPTPMEGLSGGVCGSTPPFMSQGNLQWGKR